MGHKSLTAHFVGAPQNREQNNLSDSYYWSTFVDMVSGAVAGFCADLTVHPLDTLKARFQFQHGVQVSYHGIVHAFVTVLKEEGVRKGLYAGVGAVLIGSIPSNALTFAVYASTKRALEAHGNSLENVVLTDLFAGAAGEIAALTTYVPCEVVAKRMQTEAMGHSRHYRSIWDAFRVITQTEGIRGLYTGLTPTMLRDIPFTSLQFTFFELLKMATRRWNQREHLSHIETLNLGIIAGGLAAAMTTPFDVIKTRLQTQRIERPKYKGIFHCIILMSKEEGFLAFFKGMVMRVLWVAPASGITLGIYENLVHRLDKRRGEQSNIEKQLEGIF
ncbi:mitochondrial carrier (BOU / S-adenosylmethionine carrier) [Galdieria sulphuraria]|uniref:Mitochondrial carrier (BOU / S-adenosylmethionine carrier) n=1 Tax=Galdieria sulphuraria TaxID=130081 RepID=M2XIM3_GALSU|nr:mitochondrial carrier (BOU / S-adenosylmethionine carrier) [Galdieria sulphuraria]EME29947.1 mitochondrial carrier (BOU / S-adenosylmethionine carrier) [Galdieria sulphuraria]|eukprot:XP_005706467.1 mitochondrial carrier (BOU / S-adenosylmethionine carrier) [Galdieria sulphuraria]